MATATDQRQGRFPPPGWDRWGSRDWAPGARHHQVARRGRTSPRSVRRRWSDTLAPQPRPTRWARRETRARWRATPPHRRRRLSGRCGLSPPTLHRRRSSGKHGWCHPRRMRSDRPGSQARRRHFEFPGKHYGTPPTSPRRHRSGTH